MNNHINKNKIKPKDKYKEKINELKSDFRKFVYVIHKEIGLAKPTKLQYDLCNVIQSDNKRLIIEAFRGCGKSHITALYVLWRLMKNPFIRIMVVSASKDRSYTFTAFVQKIIEQVPFLKYLKATTGQRYSKDKFDVGPAKNAPHQDNSVVALGISSQLAGKRSDLIIGDDVEGTNNSETESKRKKLIKQCEEFESIIVPEGKTKIIFLGTPQTENSIYNKLSKRGYKLYIWPALKPKNDKKYKGHLAPYIYNLKKPFNTTTDPERFSDIYLEDKLNSFSKAGFTLQFLLDTTLSDVEKYPLKLNNLIVYNTPINKAPIDITYSSTNQFEFPNFGLDGDKLFKPSFVDNIYKPFEDIVMSIDPAGAGEDETAYTVLGMVHSKLYILDIGAFKSPGARDDTLDKLGEIAINFNVKNTIIETNFGGYFEIISGHFKKLGITATMNGMHASIQKEKRIIDTLEPIMYKHSLIISEEVLRKEQQFLSDMNDNEEDRLSIDSLGTIEDNSNIYKNEDKINYSLLHQLTRITYDRNSLVHDDRLDSLALACYYYKEKLDRNIDRAKEIFKNRQREEFVKNYIKSYNKTLGKDNNPRKGIIKKRKGVL